MSALASSPTVTRRNPLVAFVPWLVFGIVAKRSSVQVGAAAALAAAALVAAPSFAARRPKLLEVASIVAFVALLTVALVTHAGDGSVLARYARAFAAGGLALIAFGSLLVVPFTEQYAREMVSPAVWLSAGFRHTNRLFTAVWGAVFTAMAASHVIAGAIDSTRAQTIFNWAVPIALVIAMLRWMDSYRMAHAVPEDQRAR